MFRVPSFILGLFVFATCRPVTQKSNELKSREHEVLQYARSCMDALEVERIPAFDCDAGVLLNPLETIAEGQSRPVSVETIRRAQGEQVFCDKPTTFLVPPSTSAPSHACDPLSRVLKTAGDDGVTWVVDCPIADASAYQHAGSPQGYTSVNVIGYKQTQVQSAAGTSAEPKVTTCFLKGKAPASHSSCASSTQLFSGKQPELQRGDPNSQNEFSQSYDLPVSSMGSGCVGCHQAGPLLLTPHVAGLKDISGDLLLERPTGGYQVVGGAELDEAIRRELQEWGQEAPRDYLLEPVVLKPGIARSCQSCHPIGGGRVCDEMVRAIFEPLDDTQRPSTLYARMPLSPYLKKEYSSVAWHVSTLPRLQALMQSKDALEYKDFIDYYGDEFRAITDCCDELKEGNLRCWDSIERIPLVSGEKG